MRTVTRLPVIDPVNFDKDLTLLNAIETETKDELHLFLGESINFDDSLNKNDTLVIESTPSVHGQKIVYSLDDVVSIGYCYKEKQFIRIEPLNQNKSRKTLILEASIHNFKIYGILKRIIRPLD